MYLLGKCIPMLIHYCRIPIKPLSKLCSFHYSCFCADFLDQLQMGELFGGLAAFGSGSSEPNGEFVSASNGWKRGDAGHPINARRC